MRFSTDCRPLTYLGDDDRIYPCANCGKMRSKNEGGELFTVCDACWDDEDQQLLREANAEPQSLPGQESE